MCCLLALTIAHAACAESPASDSGIVAAASIGSVTVNNENVFDLDNPEEDKSLYRLLNRLHIKTRPDVISRQLLFQQGDTFSFQKMAESERLLRSNRYLQEVTIEPVRAEDGHVDVNVTTADAWTLIPKVSASRSGGENNAAIGVQEMNLLGTGIAVQVQFKSDVDRDSSMLKIVDRNLGGSRYALETLFASNSDGYTRLLAFGKPFYSLDSRDSSSIRFYDNEQIESFYTLGEEVSDYRHEASQHELSVGWSQGLRDGWSRRFTTGLAMDQHRFSAAIGTSFPSSVIPDDRDLLYPFVGVELVEDNYKKGSNYDQMHRTEDRFLGTRLSARLGLASEGAGSDRNAWIFDARAETSFLESKTGSLHLAADLGGRFEDAGAQNLALDLSASYYKRQSEKRLLFVQLSGTYGENLDLDQYLMLGGDNGLRGYPLRYQSGDKRAQLTIEQRYFTDWYPFRLFHVGGAVFFDAGRTWGVSPVGASSDGWLRDVGLGLRIGNSRSGLGRMTHIDLAFPLDGGNDIADVQFLVSTRKSF